ncbi:hypothetical protein TRVL_05512 [Trypanosoma vivax]|nr:hypothetical protein TRVL_05512 [Trypanosoma vivax]
MTVEMLVDGATLCLRKKGPTSLWGCRSAVQEPWTCQCAENSQAHRRAGSDGRWTRSDRETGDNRVEPKQAQQEGTAERRTERRRETTNKAAMCVGKKWTGIEDKSGIWSHAKKAGGKTTGTDQRLRSSFVRRTTNSRRRRADRFGGTGRECPRLIRVSRDMV